MCSNLSCVVVCPRSWFCCSTLVRKSFFREVNDQKKKKKKGRRRRRRKKTTGWKKEKWKQKWNYIVWWMEGNSRYVLHKQTHVLVCRQTNRWKMTGIDEFVTRYWRILFRDQRTMSSLEYYWFRDQRIMSSLEYYWFRDQRTMSSLEYYWFRDQRTMSSLEYYWFRERRTMSSLEYYWFVSCLHTCVAVWAWNGGHKCYREASFLGGWLSLCTLYLLACQATVTVDDSGLCCGVPC